MSEERSLNLDVLRQHLASPDPEHRIKALRSVLQYADPRALDVVLPLIETETSSKVRATMIGVVGRLGDASRFQQLFPHVEDESATCRLAVAQAIVRLRQPSFFPLLVRLTGDRSGDVRTFCGKALASLGKENLQKLLEVMFGSPTSWMKRSAVRACRQFRSPGLVGILERALLDPDPTIVEEGKKGLKRLADHGIERARELVEADFALVSPPGKGRGAQVAPDEVQNLDASGPMISAARVGGEDRRLDWGEYRASTEDLVLPPPPEDLRAKVFGRDDEEVDDGAEEELDEGAVGAPAESPAPAVAAAPAVVSAPDLPPLKGAEPNPSSMTPSKKAAADRGANRSCTRCGETVRREALKCRYCGEIFDEQAYAVALRSGGAMVIHQPYVKGNRLAAYMLDMMPAMLMNLIPFIGAMISGIWLVCRDGLEEGRFTFKRALGLRVVDARTGEPASLQQSAIRNCLFLPGAVGPVLIFVPVLGPLVLAGIAFVTTAIFFIDVLMVALGRRRITDTWAGTAVIQGDGAKVMPAWAKAVVILVPMIPMGLAALGFAMAFAARR